MQKTVRNITLLGACFLSVPFARSESMVEGMVREWIEQGCIKITGDYTRQLNAHYHLVDMFESNRKDIIAYTDIVSNLSKKRVGLYGLIKKDFMGYKGTSLEKKDISASYKERIRTFCDKMIKMFNEKVDDCIVIKNKDAMAEIFVEHFYRFFEVYHNRLEAAVQDVKKFLEQRKELFIPILMGKLDANGNVLVLPPDYQKMEKEIESYLQRLDAAMENVSTLCGIENDDRKMSKIIKEDNNLYFILKLMEFSCLAITEEMQQPETDEKAEAIKAWLDQLQVPLDEQGKKDLEQKALKVLEKYKEFFYLRVMRDLERGALLYPVHDKTMEVKTIEDIEKVKKIIEETKNDKLKEAYIALTKDPSSWDIICELEDLVSKKTKAASIERLVSLYAEKVWHYLPDFLSFLKKFKSYLQITNDSLIKAIKHQKNDGLGIHNCVIVLSHD